MLQEMIEIVKGAGKVLLQYHGKKLKIEEKGGHRGNNVTEADLASDKYIQEQVAKLLPNVTLLTEEMKDTAIDMKGTVLIADPLDGTTCFSKGNTGKFDGFCVILGLCQDANPIIGVVYDPLNDTLYYAQKGKGAFVEEKGKKKELKVTTQTSLKDSIMLLRDLRNVGNHDELDNFLNELAVKERYEGGGYAIKAIAVALGTADFYIHATQGWMIGRWDTCGVEVIIKEAGGNVCDFFFNDLDYTKHDDVFTKKALITSNKVIDKELKETLANFK